MAIRFATTSALALAASLLVAPAARAQGFFSFFEMSPRQVAGMLEDDGYRLRGPMLRRGDVYICDVVSITGRPARLIVDARDGRVLERFANNPHWRRSGDGGLRPPRDVGDNGQSRSWDNGDSSAAGRQTAMGGDFNAPSRVYGSDALFGGWKSDAAPTPNAEPRPKPKHHASKKHKEPAVAKDSAASPDASADAKTSDKPTDSSSLAAVAPSAGADVGKPDAAKTEATPRPMPSPDREQAKAEGEKRPIVAPSPAPKVEAPHKKLNDLPVGTLD
jgi:hypothetical protein